MSVIVKPEHVRTAKMCMPGARCFFERHGLSWSKFVRDGIAAEKLEALGDAMALKVVEAARGQQ